MSDYRYPWPASALSPAEMKLLYVARETHPDRLPITRLIAEAVRSAYQSSQPKPEKEKTIETIDPEK